MKLTDSDVYRDYNQAVTERPWLIRLYDRLRDRQEALLRARRGGRYGILVRDDREAIAWRRLEMLRGRVLRWINECFKELDGRRGLAELHDEMRRNLSG